MPQLPFATLVLPLLLFSAASCHMQGGRDGLDPGAGATAPTAGPGAATTALDEPHQVLWQRSLADAEALARASGRPLLLALNMDGESASDRIWHEEYRDPQFVALTRRCVCLGASVFRHNARDYDDQGHRIPCPRFGCITCGEHVALEPQLFARYLADGERVAPRNARVRADGSMAFDLSRCFALPDIDRALAAAVADREAAPEPATGGGWVALASARDGVGRGAFEAAIAAVSSEAAIGDVLAAIAAHGDAGSLPALRLVAARAPELSPPVQAQLVATAAGLGLGDAVTAALRELAEAPDAAFDDPGPTPRQRVFRDLAGDAALADATAPLRALLEAAAVVTRREHEVPKAGGPTDAMPATAELERQLERFDAEAVAHRDDAQWLADFAKASLDLGRRRLEEKGRGAELLFEDAARSYERALAKEPEHYAWWIERARTAYFLGRFADQVEFGSRAFAEASGVPVASGAVAGGAAADDARAIEALRWVGDGEARLLGDRPDAARVADGMRALGTVAASAYGSDGDWLTFVSFCALAGCDRAAVAAAFVGALRYPASRELRQALNGALFRRGRPDLMPVAAESLDGAAATADTAWFAGYAWLLAAEDARRAAQAPTARRAGTNAGVWFARAAERNAEYRANCEWFRAAALVGNGLAAADAGDRGAGADDLVAAVQVHKDLASLRDGNGYDVLDLVDKILEWRADGPSDVAPVALFDRLDAVAPDMAFWAVAVGDSALREALRADGRNPVRRVRETVDAGGRKISMAMGVPDAEGDRWLEASIAVLRRGALRPTADEARRALAQSLTIRAERQLERGALDGVQAALAEAAPLVGEIPAAAGAGEPELRALAARLRSHLGEARPRWREGR